MIQLIFLKDEEKLNFVLELRAAVSILSSFISTKRDAPLPGARIKETDV